MEVSQINEPGDLIELVMTQHWDMQACPCTFCEAGRIMGFRAHAGFIHWRSQGYDMMYPKLNLTGGRPIAPWEEVRDEADAVVPHV